MNMPVRRCQSGVTLIELLIVVTIVGILAMVAVPGFQDSVRKSRRADARIALLETAQRLERCYTQFGIYDDENCEIASPFSSPDGFYLVTVVRQPTTFTLTAESQGAQTDDTACSEFGLNELGERSASGDDAQRCW